MENILEYHIAFKSEYWMLMLTGNPSIDALIFFNTNFPGLNYISNLSLFMSSKINQAHTKEVKMKLRQLDYILVWDLDCRNKVLALNYYGSKLVKSKKIKEDIYHDRDDIICKMNIWYLRNFFLEVIFLYFWYQLFI